MKSNEQQTNFVPMAYNPAAPAAPEPIAHREKTPPPIDGAGGTGLAQAAYHDNMHHPGSVSAQGYQSPQQGSLPPPPPQPASSAAYTSATTSGYNPSSPQDHRTSVTSQTTPSFGPPVSAQGRHSSVAAELYVPHQGSAPVTTPGTQFYNSIQQPAKPLQHVHPQYADYLTAGSSPQPPPQAQPPPGGFAQHNYGQSNQQYSGNPYDVHNQVYRPTEEEAAPHHRKPSRQSTSKPQSKFDAGADRVEKGVGRLFKKIEKKIG